jgi:Xaa-Pro aminopeptidase
MEERLEELLMRSQRIFFRLGIHQDLDGIVIQALRNARSRGPRKGDGPRGVLDPGEILDELRLRKDARELEEIRRTTRITVDGFLEVMRGARPGMGEWEVESILESSFRRAGAQGPAFPTIVGSGSNGCTLHYAANGDVLEDGDLVLVDGGAQAGLYAGDVTRTFPVGSRFSEAQRSVYQVVQAAHRTAIEGVRPGIPVAQIHEAALRELLTGLVELNLLTGEIDGLMETKAHEPYFPHQTSHWLGMDVHDVGDYARGGESRRLEAGMVLTVEPGLYFRPDPEGTPTPFDGIGIRIEDDVLVTSDGAEVLTAGLPVDPDEVEALRA